MMMTPCNIDPHILRYIEMVESGEIRSCEEQKLLVKHVQNCFETEEIYTDSPQLENYLSLAKYFPFEQVFPWEEFVIGLHLCTYKKSSGMPRWPDLLSEIGRGAGKDGLIALYSMCLISPYHNIPLYDVDICANNKDQSTRPVKDLVSALESPRYTAKLKRFFRWTKEGVTGLQTKGEVKGHTNSPKGRDGLRSGIVILNEIHQYENYDNINVFTTGLGKKPHPRRAYFTTNGDVCDGPLDDLLEKAERILRQGEPDDGFLPFICKLDSREEVDNPDNWQKANPSLPYNPTLMEETRKEYREWKKNPAQLSAFMTKRMNIREGQHNVEVTSYDNIKATKRTLPDLSGWSCTVGIDYASLRDIASINLHFRKGEERFDINHSWLNLNSDDLPRIKAPWKGWADPELWEEEPPLTLVDDIEISPEVLAQYISKMAKKYSITKLAVDNFRYALLSNALAKIGFDAKERKNVYLVRPSDIMRVQPVIASCFDNQRFTWGNNPALRWAVNNTKLVRSGRKEGTDTGNFYYAKIEAKSRKTDPFMALVHSMVIEDCLSTLDYENMPGMSVIVG